MTNTLASLRHLMLAYYAATVLFLLLDILLGLNVRIAFFDASLPLRAGYYGVCFACISMREIINFVMSGSIAYLAWSRGMQEFRQRLS